MNEYFIKVSNIQFGAKTLNHDSLMNHLRETRFAFPDVKCGGV